MKWIFLLVTLLVAVVQGASCASGAMTPKAPDVVRMAAVADSIYLRWSKVAQRLGQDVAEYHWAIDRITDDAAPVELFAGIVPDTVTGVSVPTPEVAPGECHTYQATVFATNTRGVAGSYATSPLLHLCAPDAGPLPPDVDIDTIPAPPVVPVDSITMAGLPPGQMASTVWSDLKWSAPMLLLNIGQQGKLCAYGWSGGAVAVRSSPDCPTAPSIWGVIPFGTLNRLRAT